jgi:hypothetical protein
MNTEFDWLFGRLRRETLKKQHTHRVEGGGGGGALPLGPWHLCSHVPDGTIRISSGHVHKNGSTKKLFKICNYCVEDFLVPSALL